MLRELALDRLPVAALVLDEEWGVVASNGLARRVLGLDEAQPYVSGGFLGECFEPADEVVTRLARGAMEPGSRAHLRSVRLRGSGTRSHVDVLAQRLDLVRSPQRGGAEPRGPQWIVVLLDADERVAKDAELARVQRALAESERLRTKMDVLQTELATGGAAPTIIGSSAPILRMLDQIERVGPSPATVLILGESGSGKELVARAIHAASPRRGKAMIAVNCASLPESLLESELFGHERGAFTGADRQRLGKFELADSGTLFLDEVGELSLQAQAKLLRVLQEGTFERVGGAETIEVDVRLIAATHRDLATLVQRGRFREDLYYRLHVFKIDVPPLRDRVEDIRPLAEYLHELHARRMARPVQAISERSLRRLMTYRWPGNVRELENSIERATVLATGAGELEIELPEGPTLLSGAQSASKDSRAIPRDVLLDLTLDQLQRLQIMHALETSRYRVFGENGSAAKLGINPQTLLSRMDKLGIPRPREMRRSLDRGRPRGSAGGGADSSE